MTIEAKGKLYGLLPLRPRELTYIDGELTVLHSDSSLTAIRVLSEHELAVFPYIPTGEPFELKKGKPKVLVRNQIRAANINGQILERTPGIVYTIDWHL